MPHTPDWLQASKPLNCYPSRNRGVRCPQDKWSTLPVLHTHAHTVHRNQELSHSQPMQLSCSRGQVREQSEYRDFQSESGPLHFSVSCLEKRHFRFYFKHQSRATDERGGEKRRQVRTGETELTVKTDLQCCLSPGWDTANSKHVAFPLVVVNINTAVLAKGMLVIFSHDLQVCEYRQADL